MVIAIGNIIKGVKSKIIILVTGLLVADNGSYLVTDSGDRIKITTRQN